VETTNKRVIDLKLRHNVENGLSSHRNIFLEIWPTVTN